MANENVVVKETQVINYKIGNNSVSLTKDMVEKLCAGGDVIGDDDFVRFANLCKDNKLNPYTKEAWIINTGKRMQIMIGKEGYFKMADSNPSYDGIQDGVIVEDKNGNLLELEGCFVPPGAKLLGGWAKAYSKDKKFPKVAKCGLSEYCGNSPLWTGKPAVMINKVAKCTALRDLFPTTYADTYDESEISNETKQNKSQKKEVIAVQEPPSLATNSYKPMALDDALNFMINAKSKDGKEKQMLMKDMLNKVTTKEAAEASNRFLLKEAKAKVSDQAEACKTVFLAIKNGQYAYPLAA